MKSFSGRTQRLKLNILAAFLLVAGVVGLLFTGREHLKPPLSRCMTDVGYMSVYGGNDTYYAIDGGKGRVIKLENGGFAFEIKGAGNAKSFYQAEDICVNESDGSFYVQSVDWDESGFLLASERILHFDTNGKYIDTVYQINYEQKDEVNKHRLFDIEYDSDGLKFLYVDEKNIYWYRINENGSEKIATFEYDRALTMFQNFTQDGNNAVLGVDKRGKIIRFSNKGVEKIYQTPSGNNEVLYSVALDNEHGVYFVDIYNFELKKVTSVSSTEVVTSSSELMDREFAPGEGQLLAVRINDSAEGRVFAAMVDGHIVSMDGQGNVILCEDEFTPVSQLIIKRVAAWTFLIVSLIAAVYFILMVVMQIYANRYKIAPSTQIEAAMALFAIIITMGTIAQTSVSFRENFINNIGQNLEVVAVIGSGEIKEEWISAVNSASDYMNEPYKRMSDYLYRLTTEKHNYDSRYGAEIDIIDSDGRAYSIVFPDNSIGAYFPKEASSKAEIEEVYKHRQAFVSYSSLEAGGSFIYGRAPIFNDEGEVIAVLSIGQDSLKVNLMLEEITKRISLNIILIVIVLMFLVNEIFAYVSERKKFKSTRPEDFTCIGDKKIPVQMLRICAFSVSFVLNMTSSFLSVYTSSFWDESLGIPESLAGAIPLFANNIFVALSALFCPWVQSKVGFRTLTLIGGLCSLSGDFLAGLSVNYISIVLALLLNGLGFGILINSVSIAVGTIDGDEKRQSALTKYNAGCVSGINCGMIAGSFLAGAVAYNQVFFVTTALWAAQLFLFIYLGRFITKKPAPPVQTYNRKTFLFPPSGLCYVFMVSLPYAIMGGFLYFYIPIYASAQGYNEKYVSLLMMIYAACGILLGGNITKLMWKWFDNKSIVVAVAQALLAWIIIAQFKNIWMVSLGVLILGLSFCYGTNVAVEAFLNIKGMERISEDNAMSVYNFSQNMGQSISSIVCGEIMAVGMFKGMGVFAIITAVLTTFYFVVVRRKG